jgi:hypothetical protein
MFVSVSLPDRIRRGSSKERALRGAIAMQEPRDDVCGSAGSNKPLRELRLLIQMLERQEAQKKEREEREKKAG